MRLTVGDLRKWLSEANANDVVTISESGEYINVGPAESGMSIWIGDDEPLIPDGVEIVEIVEE